MDYNLFEQQQWLQKIYTSSKVTFVLDTGLSKDIRNPLSELTMKSLRTLLNPLLQLIETLANKESIDPQTIATYAMQLLDNDVRD